MSPDDRMTVWSAAGDYVEIKLPNGATLLVTFADADRPTHRSKAGQRVGRVQISLYGAGGADEEEMELACTASARVRLEWTTDPAGVVVGSFTSEEVKPDWVDPV